MSGADKEWADCGMFVIENSKSQITNYKQIQIPKFKIQNKEHFVRLFIVWKFQITNYKQYQMIGIQNSKQYDLEERTAKFAERWRDYVMKLPRNLANIEYGKQLIRSSGSQAANYIEANEALGKKDFQHRIRICRKETKESCLWLRLSQPGNDENLKKERQELLKEGGELRNIFTSILNKTK